VTSQKLNLKILLTIGVLGTLATFKPTPSWAQAEIDPDHYDTPSVVVSTTNTPTTAKPKVNHSAKSFRGRFSLPVDVSYPGVVLEPGSYSISIHFLGKQNLVTFTSDRTGVRVQIRAQVSAESNAEGPSTLLIEGAGKPLQLMAIQLNEPRMTIDLQARQRGNVCLNRELIPISDTRPESAEN